MYKKYTLEDKIDLILEKLNIKLPVIELSFSKKCNCGEYVVNSKLGDYYICSGCGVHVQVQETLIKEDGRYESSFKIERED